MVTFNFDGIGTKWQIDIYQELSKTREASLLSLIKNRIEIFDKTYSRFRADSLVTEMSKKAGVFLLPEDAKQMFSLYHDLYKITNGYFTPLVGDLLSDAGYDATYTLRQKNKLKTPPMWEEIMEYKYPNMIIKKSVILDFGAAGKGYLVDLVAKVIEAENLFEYCIDAGGDILHKNKKPIRIGLENPLDTNKVLGVCMLKNGSLCGSSGNRRAWGNFTHIINPKTLTSPTDIIAVWVVTETAILCDALTTCLFFVKPATLLNNYNFEYLIVYKDFSIKKSANFSDEIFITSTTNNMLQ